MLSYRFVAVLVAIGLLLSTLGCISEPINVNGTGRYKLDNVERRCVVQGDFTFPARLNQVYDQLNVNLVTTPEPATGPEYVVLTFSKQRGQPATTYQLLSLVYRTAGGVEATYSVNTATIQEDRDKYAGTFTGASPTGTTPPLLDITDGMFADVHVEP